MSTDDLLRLRERSRRDFFRLAGVTTVGQDPSPNAFVTGGT